MPVMVVILQEQLLIRERELAIWENTLIVRENNLVAAECALGRACMECDVGHDWTVAIHQDYQARLRASTAGHRHSLDFDRFLSGR
jgi:N-acetylglutamate synthase-like GNAT family acetyltransferase